MRRLPGRRPRTRRAAQRFHLRCLPAWITPARTRNSLGYENQTLLQIAATDRGAARDDSDWGAESIDSQLSADHPKAGDRPRVSPPRRHQHDYDFTVRGRPARVLLRASLEAQPAVLTLYRNTSSASASWPRPIGSTNRRRPPTSIRRASSYTQTAQARPTVATGDMLKVVARCENGQQALERASAGCTRPTGFW